MLWNYGSEKGSNISKNKLPQCSNDKNPQIISYKLLCPVKYIDATQCFGMADMKKGQIYLDMVFASMSCYEP